MQRVRRCSVIRCHIATPDAKADDIHSWTPGCDPWVGLGVVSHGTYLDLSTVTSGRLKGRVNGTDTKLL